MWQTIQRDKKIKTLFVEMFLIVMVSEALLNMLFFIKIYIFPSFVCFLIFLFLFLMYINHSYSRVCIWICLLLDQPILPSLLLHTTVYAENDCTTLQILCFPSLIPYAFFLTSNVPAFKYKYQNKKYQPHLYGNPYTKRHKCRLI